MRIVVWLLFVIGCGGGGASVAKSARYDHDIEAVYTVVYNYAVAKFRVVDGDPVKNRMKTSWVQVQTTEGFEGGASDPNHLRQTRIAKYFVRFDIAIVGPRPWQVVLEGHAAKLDANGSVPIEYQVNERPMWLEDRTDTVAVEIHDELVRQLH